MNGSFHKRGQAELQALVELSRRQPVSYGAVESDASLLCVTARLGAAAEREKRLKRAVPLALLAVLSITLFVTYSWPTRERAPLHYVMQSGVILDGGYLREVNGTGVHLTFEEGTRFALEPGARARLRSVSASGARLGLESGAASFDVTPNAQHRWEVEVGPFLVQVKGTTFQVGWDPAGEQFQLNLKHGRVVVSGPLSGGELTLTAGQHLAVDLVRGETRITEGRTTKPATEVREAHAPTASPQVTPPTAVSSATTPDVAPVESSALKRDWVGDMARGRWHKIVRQAEQAGLANVHATASAEDLFTLANAARYEKRTQLAHDSLVTLRRRFAHSARAVDALFLLGRLEESRSAPNEALVWYDKYLESSANGAYAAEALGRKMTLLMRSHGAAMSRPVAEQYLRQFPNGSYAPSARALLEAR